MRKTGKEGITTDISDNSKPIITNYSLMQNYPNPFNPSTTISFSVPQQSKIQLSVYNVIGEKVADLVNGEVSAGNHSINFDASSLSSGIYFYRLVANDFIATKKLAFGNKLALFYSGINSEFILEFVRFFTSNRKIFLSGS